MRTRRVTMREATETARVATMGRETRVTAGMICTRRIRMDILVSMRATSHNGEDGDEDKGEDSVDNEDGDEGANSVNISGSRDGGGDEDGSEDGDGNNGEGSNGSRSVSGRKDDKGRNGMKRNNQDDKPAARAKRMKRDVSGGHQPATQL